MYSAVLLNSYWIRLSIACSQGLYFLFKVRQARVIKKTAGEFIDRQRKGAFIFLSREVADVCEKNEKKKKV